ncbi:zinc finger, c4 type (two domains) domain-containing protein [Ditylenchus destructor]|uniref:Zinc finger, c4 type (Two domains) domain-containing protein n=1 Tax=Ditylenchus destructor TaxID=166010 RepID=A0AAD4MXX4_9BILA|nr:zinc finger, c4 type (two domains) domain-containing protein [Ditylenchus destructor]
MQAINNAHQTTNAFEPNTSLYSGSFSKAPGASVEFFGPTKTFFGPSKTFFDSAYLTVTSTGYEPQNDQLKPTTLVQDMEVPTKCLVCDCPTNCCHYDVPSCNGCKTFFRRSLITYKTYACNYNGMCHITNVSEINRCRACRFDRCVLVGMNPRAMKLPTSVDVVKLSDKVSSRRRHLSQKYGGRCPVLIGKTGPVFEETIEDKIIKSLVYVEQKVRQIRESSRWLSDSVMGLSFREILQSNNENILARADQYPKEAQWPFYRPADIHEALRKEKRRPHFHILDMFLSIEMARTMPVLAELDYSDQEALLKQIILANAILLQAFYSYQMKSETLIMPNGFTPAKMPQPKIDLEQGKTRIAEKMNLSSCRAMVAISRIQMTMEEFVLLKAIIYSHSAIHGLSERGRVLLEKESVRYSKTLMKHLQSRMGAAPGAKKYAEIISFVDCLFHVAQCQREMHILISAAMSPPFCLPPYMETIMYA